MFLHVSVILFTGGVSVPACTTGHMTGAVSVWGDLCPRGTGLPVRGGESLSRGVSVRETPLYGNAWAVRMLEDCIPVGCIPGGCLVQGGR